jgi:hypothetical protein
LMLPAYAYFRTRNLRSLLITSLSLCGELDAAVRVPHTPRGSRFVGKPHDLKLANTSGRAQRRDLCLITPVSGLDRESR